MRWYHYLALFFSRHIGLRIGVFTSNLTVSMIPLPIGVALRHGGCRWAMA